eukprot:g4381.t1
MDITDAVMDSINVSIVNTIKYNSSFEKPWDGYGGLVSIGDSVMFKEEGLVTALAPDSSMTSHDLSKVKSPKSIANSLSGSANNTVKYSNQAKTMSGCETSIPMQNEKLLIPDANAKTQDFNPAISINAEDFRGQKFDQRSSKSRVSCDTASAESHMRSKTAHVPASVDSVISDVEKFKSRLIAVRLEGLSVRATTIKCAAIAEEAFALALKKLKDRLFTDALLLADVADSACPTSATSAKNKILKLKQSAHRGLQSSSIVI